MSDEVQVLREALEQKVSDVVTTSTQRAEYLAALDSLERELITYERAANDLFLENEALRSALRKIATETVGRVGKSPLPSPGAIIARAALGEVPA